jgi:uncharacterized protein YndB with AHSA1/START domain
MEALGIDIEHSVLVRAPRDRVYDVLTTAEGWDAWFTTGTRLDARPGGTIELRWRAWGPDEIDVDDGGPVLEAIAPARFVFQWGDPPTTVELDLAADVRGTVVSVREHGYRDTPSGRAKFVSCATGWGEALTLLKFYVERGVTY